jgi:hypothetical protein
MSPSSRWPGLSVSRLGIGVGDFLAPTLLAKFGDDRERFPHPGSLPSLAGTCPVTEQSGKSRRIFFSLTEPRPATRPAWLVDG